MSGWAGRMRGRGPVASGGFEPLVFDIDADNAVEATTTELLDTSPNGYLFEGVRANVSIITDGRYNGHKNLAATTSSFAGMICPSVSLPEVRTLYAVAGMDSFSGSLAFDVDLTTRFVRGSTGPRVKTAVAELLAGASIGADVVCVWAARFDGANSRFAIHPQGGSAEVVTGTLDTNVAADLEYNFLGTQPGYGYWNSDGSRLIMSDGGHDDDRMDANIATLKDYYAIVTV